MSENKNVLNVDTKKSDLSPDDKHMLKSMFWRSWLLFSSFTMVKMQDLFFPPLIPLGPTLGREV